MGFALIILTALAIHCVYNIDSSYIKITNLSDLGTTDDLFLHDQKLNEDLNRIKNIKSNIIKESCLELIKKYISENKDKVMKILKESQHDKSQTFDKYIALMIQHCQKEISEKDYEKMFTQGNFDYQGLERLISIDTDIFADKFIDLTFSKEETDAIKGFQDIIYIQHFSVPHEKNISINDYEKFIYLACGVGIFFVFALLKCLTCSKKNKIN